MVQQETMPREDTHYIPRSGIGLVKSPLRISPDSVKMTKSLNQPIVHIAMVVLFGLAIYFTWSGLFSSGPSITAESILEDAFPSQEMLDQAKEYDKPQIIKVTDNVHVAIGFAIANTIILNAPEGLIIVDTTESVEAARNVSQAIREMIDRPIKAIVYTHNHADHCYGTKAFIGKSDDSVQIWAHHLFGREMDKFMAVQGVIFPRSLRQFGVLLPRQVNAGIGSRAEYSYNKTMGLVFPTNLVYEDMDVEIAGLELRFLHIPGETEDQIGVWIPGENVFMCADDIYRAFPNLYAIRGTPIRNVLDWLQSVDRIRYMKPKHLVPSHSRPVSGETRIYDLLTTYRDAIQYVHDQTIRYMNMGMYPQDIVERVKLPGKLWSHSHLAEMYGTVEWSVRTVFNQYLGWFSGNVAELSTLSTKDKAKHMIDLAGSRKNLLAAASKALEEEEFKWALELATQIFVLDEKDDGALSIRCEALKALARAQTSTNGRHYYITTALEDYNLVENKVPQHALENYLEHMTLHQIFTLLPTRLDPEKTLGVSETTIFHFTDVDKVFTSYIRNNVNEIIEQDSVKFTVRVKMTTSTWHKLLTRQVSGLSAYMSGDVQVDGGITAFQRILSYYDFISS